LSGVIASMLFSAITEQLQLGSGQQIKKPQQDEEAANSQQPMGNHVVPGSGLLRKTIAAECKCQAGNAKGGPNKDVLQSHLPAKLRFLSTIFIVAHSECGRILVLR